MCMLRESIMEVQRCEDETSVGIRNIASQVKTVNRHNKAPLKDLLLRSRAQRHKLQMIAKKRQSLQQHLETLETSELNQQVISSVKETSDVLKNMGLAQNVESVDELMIDMAESHDDVRLIQTGLAAGHGEDVDSAELDAELELLLSEDGDSNAPPHDNTMGEPALAAPHVSKESPQAPKESPHVATEKKKVTDKKKKVRDHTIMPALSEELVSAELVTDDMN